MKTEKVILKFCSCCGRKRGKTEEHSERKELHECRCSLKQLAALDELSQMSQDFGGYDEIPKSN